jgi:hypothetical protein
MRASLHPCVMRSSLKAKRGYMTPALWLDINSCSYPSLTRESSPSPSLGEGSPVRVCVTFLFPRECGVGRHALYFPLSRDLSHDRATCFHYSYTLCLGIVRVRSCHACLGIDETYRTANPPIGGLQIHRHYSNNKTILIIRGGHFDTNPVFIH